MDTNRDEFATLIAVQHLISHSFLSIMRMFRYYCRIRDRRVKQRRPMKKYSLIGKIPSQVKHIRHLVELDDEICVNYLRMNRAAFAKLCYLVEHRGLGKNRKTSVAEKVAMFLYVIAHHAKNRIVYDKFGKSAETVSRNVNDVLKAVLKLHSILLVSQQPVGESCADERWKYFKGCIGALDGTHIDVMVSDVDKPRYRSRNGGISNPPIIHTLYQCGLLSLQILSSEPNGSLGDVIWIDKNSH